MQKGRLFEGKSTAYLVNLIYKTLRCVFLGEKICVVTSPSPLQGLRAPRDRVPCLNDAPGGWCDDWASTGSHCLAHSVLQRPPMAAETREAAMSSQPFTFEENSIPQHCLSSSWPRGDRAACGLHAAGNATPNGRRSASPSHYGCL